MPIAKQKKGYALAIAGGLWFGVVVFVIAGNIILRRTPFGGIARALDTLPSPLREGAFWLFWIFFLVGWIVPIIWSVRLLNRANDKRSASADGSG